MQTPSAKVVTSMITALAAAMVMALAGDASVLEPLPDWLEALAVGGLTGLAGYMKRETNPARSELGR